MVYVRSVAVQKSKSVAPHTNLPINLLTEVGARDAYAFKSWMHKTYLPCHWENPSLNRQQNSVESNFEKGRKITQPLLSRKYL